MGEYPTKLKTKYENLLSSSSVKGKGVEHGLLSVRGMEEHYTFGISQVEICKLTRPRGDSALRIKHGKK